MVKGRIHSIESFGSVDGPGTRFIIFVQGCSLRCLYCHNADTDELLNQAERYRPYWGPEGGITVSGGEPLLQLDFLLELFQKAKARGIGTCIDTAGQPFTREEPFFGKFQQLMELTDILLMDIKHIDPTEHEKLCSQPQQPVMAFESYLEEKKIPVWIRHVVVPGITDQEEYLLRLGQYLGMRSNIKALDVLPYHDMGKVKYKNLGIPYPLEHTAPLSKEAAAKARQIILKGMRESRGL